MENTEYFKTYNLDYHGGEKYPHLVRDESRPDMLSDIIKPPGSLDLVAVVPSGASDRQFRSPEKLQIPRRWCSSG